MRTTLNRAAVLAAAALVVACDAESPTDSALQIGSLSALSRTELVGTVTTTHPRAFRVEARVGRKGLSGVPIVWEATGGGVSVSPIRNTTDSDGAVAATVTLGPNDGQDTVIASAPTLRGAPQVVFTATAVTVMVEARDLADGGFTPASVTVSPGSIAGWVYASGEGYPHRITFEDGVSSRDLWETSLSQQVDHYYTRLFEGPARTVRYACDYHPSEVGEVMVE